MKIVDTSQIEIRTTEVERVRKTAENVFRRFVANTPLEKSSQFMPLRMDLVSYRLGNGEEVQSLKGLWIPESGNSNQRVWPLKSMVKVSKKRSIFANDLFLQTIPRFSKCPGSKAESRRLHELQSNKDIVKRNAVIIEIHLLI